MKNMCVVMTVLSLLLSASAVAGNYVVIGKEGAKVFDEPNAKGYVTLNQNDEEVTLLPGMVFKVQGSDKGWYVIEYSPGLRGYLSEQTEASSVVSLKPGEYSVYNCPGKKLSVEKSGNVWVASVDGKKYQGELHDGTVLFFDSAHCVIYSVADIGNGPVVICYDNSVTNFF